MQSINRIRGSDGSGNASIATVQAVRSAGAKTIQVDTVSGIPNQFYASMGTPHTFSDPITGEDITVISQASAVDFKGHVDGTELEIDEIAPGYTDDGSQVGDIIIIRPITEWANNVADVLDESHEDDGKLKREAIDAAAQDAVGLHGNTKYFTESGAYEKPANLKFVIVEVQGGGGGGGGSTNTSHRVGCGGGGGGYGRKKILANELAASETVTVGFGGSGGGATSSGTHGAHSSFGSHITGYRGGQGTRAHSDAVLGGFGGGFNKADFGVEGKRGGNGGTNSSSSNGQTNRDGRGGDSHLGFGGFRNAGSNSSGHSATAGYGGGGGGGSTSTTTGAGGGNGRGGIVIVHEYF